MIKIFFLKIEYYITVIYNAKQIINQGMQKSAYDKNFFRFIMYKISF